MTARQHVRGARRALIATIVAQAALWSAATTVLLASLGAPIALVVVAAIAAAAVVLWRGAGAWSERRVALWLEERHPELRYALVTAIDPATPADWRARLDEAATGLRTGPALRVRALRAGWPAAVALAFALVVALLIPRSVLRATIGSMRARAAAPADAPVSRLAPLRAELVPPAYARRPTRRLDDPSTLDGLPGTRVTLSGPGGPDGLRATLGARALPVARRDGRWELRLALPDSAAALRLEDGRTGTSRLLVVAPTPDAPPSVRLALPARDTTVRAATFALTLDAELADDVGLASARFEIIVSAGESEGNFVSRESVAGARTFGGAREGRLRLATTLAALGVTPGGQVAVRAVATDRNDVGGPGVGYSETRVIRVARANEYDSLTADDLGVPPPVGEGRVTLSMLVQRTERLHRERARIPVAQLRDRSERLAADGEEIYTLLQEVIAIATGQEPGEHVHNEDERVGEDPRLREAAHALRDGLTELRVTRTAEALPHLYRAKRALDAYRLAGRYYIRGRVREVVVNTERVRLAGRDTGRAAPHAPRAAVVGPEGMRRAYAEAMRELAGGPERTAKAVELLTLARVEALRADTALARALGDATAALQARRDPASALARARRHLFGAAAARDSLGAWSVVP